MSDDFNTAIALSVLFDLAREINRQKTSNPPLAESLAAKLKFLGGVLGILENNPEDFLKSTDGQKTDELTDENIASLIQQRLEAKKSKDWSQADQIRDELKMKGVILEDLPGGTSWRRE